METKIIKYQQNGLNFITFVIPFKSLIKISKVLVYNDETGEGYQRKQNSIHVNKIKKYILSNLNNFKLPTSFILGADIDQINNFLNESNNETYLRIDEIDFPLFNIVDGQHRLLGLQKALEQIQNEGKKSDLIQNFPLNIVCVLTNNSNRSVELEIFVDINSKSKRVSTDLAELARFNYQILEKSLKNDINELSEHIALIIARELREKNSPCIWDNAIKFDIHSEENFGIIGVSSFRKSITGIVKLAIEKYGSELLSMEKEDLILKSNEFAKNLSNFILKCWQKSIYQKWYGCFNETSGINDYDLIVDVFFNKNYYLQKPPGVFAINSLIEHFVKAETSLNSAFDKFDVLILESRLTSEDWKMGGKFSGLNSQGGFNKIAFQICNNRQLK